MAKNPLQNAEEAKVVVEGMGRFVAKTSETSWKIICKLLNISPEMLKQFVDKQHATTEVVSTKEKLAQPDLPRHHPNDGNEPPAHNP